jgi:Zn-finger nucleic acid-binding protein
MADYLSREKAIETIQYRVCQGHGNKEHICKRGSCAYCGIMEIMSDISSIEAADVQPVKRGYWENTNTPNQLRCSKCDVIHFIAQYPHGEINYCPNCGARMDGDTD